MPRPGHRGRFLLFLGVLDVVYAFSLAAPGAGARATPFFTWLAGIGPLWTWAVAWAGVGAVCLWQAFCRRDGIGFAAAIGLKVCWGLVSVGGWLFGGFDRGYVSAAIWLALALTVADVAAWPEPDDLKGPSWTRPS